MCEHQFSMAVCVCVRSIFELWGWGRDYSELKSSIQANVSEEKMVLTVEPLNKGHVF